MPSETTDIWIELVDEVGGLSSPAEREQLAKTLANSAGPVSAVDPGNECQGTFDLVRVKLSREAVKLSQVEQIGHTMATYLGTSLDEVYINRVQ